MYRYIAKLVKNDHFGSSNDPCYIQNRVVTNGVIKRSRYIIEPPNGKTNNLHRRKQRRRSASR